MKKCLPVLVMVTAFTLVYLGCGDSGTGPSEETDYTVSGTLTKLDIADGVLGYAMLITMEGDTTYNLIYSDESPFSAGVASYSMSGVAAGTYYFVAVIDVNGNWESSDGPDEGDLTSDFHEETINQNTVVNVSDDGWELWSGGGGDICVYGTLLKNGVEDGVLGYVALADSSFNIQYSAVSEQPFSEGWTTYDIYDVMDGSYFFLAFIDVNGNADPYEPSPDAGDWVNSDPPWVWIDQNTELDVYDDEWILY